MQLDGIRVSTSKDELRRAVFDDSVICDAAAPLAGQAAASAKHGEPVLEDSGLRRGSAGHAARDGRSLNLDNDRYPGHGDEGRVRPALTDAV